MNHMGWLLVMTLLTIQYSGSVCRARDYPKTKPEYQLLKDASFRHAAQLYLVALRSNTPKQVAPSPTSTGAYPQ